MGHPFCFGWARENKDNSSGKIKRRSEQRDDCNGSVAMEGLHPTLRQRREGWGTRFVLAGRERTRTTAAARSNAGLNKGTRLQRLSGLWRVYIPPFAKDAKDGAPVLFWLGEGEQGQQRRCQQRRAETKDRPPRLRGMGRRYITPFAKDAKDGAPVFCWLGEREQDNSGDAHRVRPPPRIILSGLNLLKNSRSKSTIRTC